MPLCTVALWMGIEHNCMQMCVNVPLCISAFVFHFLFPSVLWNWTGIYILLPRCGVSASSFLFRTLHFCIKNDSPLFIHFFSSLQYAPYPHRPFPYFSCTHNAFTNNNSKENNNTSSVNSSNSLLHQNVVRYSNKLKPKLVHGCPLPHRD